MKIVYIMLFLVSFSFKSVGQNLTFPTGIGISNPYCWFSGNVLHLEAERPVLRMSPLSEGGLATIQFKGAHNLNNGSQDEFHLNYISSNTDPKIELGSYFNGGWSIVTFKGNGNVGIGTITPDEKLTVKGKIHAEEVRVDLNVPGPDYVFEQDYQLKSLPEIQAFIKENKHLPEVPSAKEMEEKGINLSEMNMLLLKKVEELTLYLIKQNEEIKELKDEIKAIKTKL